MKIGFVLLLLLFGTTGYSSQATAQPVAWTASDSGLPATISLGVTSLVIDPVKPSSLYALANTGAIFKSQDAGGSWKRSNSGFNGTFLAIARGNSALYAATPNGLVKSPDDGESWMEASAGITGRVYWLAISPSDASILYALTQRAVFRSANGGETWKAVGSVSSTEPAGFFQLAVDPAAPSTLYAVRLGSIVKSADGGETWTSIRPDVSVYYAFTSLAIDPALPSTIYASYALRPTTAAETQTGGVFKSTDGGKTWNAAYRNATPGTFIYAKSLTIDPTTPATVYVVVDSSRGSSVVKSADAGQTWGMVNDGLPTGFTGSIAIAPRAPSAIYAFSNAEGSGSLFKSAPEEATWKPSGAGLSRIDASVIAIDPTNGTLYAGVGGGLFKSSDDGASWANSFQFAAQPVLLQFGTGRVLLQTLLIDFSNPKVLYVQTRTKAGCGHNDKTVFKSSDSGVSWDDGVSPPGTGCRLGSWGLLYKMPMVMDPTDPNTLYLLKSSYDNQAELLKSGDGGANWTSIWSDLEFERELSALAVDPRSPTTLYAGVVADYDDFGMANGVYKSTDGGATWNVTGLMHQWVTELAIDPSEPSTLYAATSARGLFKTTDGGESWLAVNNGLPSLTGIPFDDADVAFVVIAPDRPNILYAGTSGRGVYKSADGGASWVQFNDGLTNLRVRALAISPASPNKLFVATADGVFSIADEYR